MFIIEILKMESWKFHARRNQRALLPCIRSTASVSMLTFDSLNKIIKTNEICKYAVAVVVYVAVSCVCRKIPSMYSVADIVRINTYRHGSRRQTAQWMWMEVQFDEMIARSDY